MTNTRQLQLRAALIRRPAAVGATVRFVRPQPKPHPRGHEPETGTLEQRINAAKATASHLGGSSRERNGNGPARQEAKDRRHLGPSRPGADRPTRT